MVPWLVLAFLPAADEEFGGVAAAAPPPAESAAAPQAEPDPDPEQAELRARMDAALRNTADAPAAPVPVRKRTKLEEDIAKAGLDATLPLLAFRIEVARAELEHEELLSKRVRPEVAQQAEERLAAIHEMSDLVERIALARLVKCTRGLGKELQVKNYRMTSGGPVLLSTTEMLAQLPFGDPQGCERITLVDEGTMQKVRRLFAVRDELRTRNFGFHEVAQRKALEQEERALAKELHQHTLFSTVVLSPQR